MHVYVSQRSVQRKWQFDPIFRAKIPLLCHLSIGQARFTFWLSKSEIGCCSLQFLIHHYFKNSVRAPIKAQRGHHCPFQFYDTTSRFRQALKQSFCLNTDHIVANFKPLQYSTLGAHHLPFKGGVG